MRMLVSETQENENEWLESILFKMNITFLFHKVLCCFVMLNSYKGGHFLFPERCLYYYDFCNAFV